MIKKIAQQIKNKIKKEIVAKLDSQNSEFDILKFKNINFENINTKQFVDMPDAQPKIKLFLPKVGITCRPHYLKIIDSFKNIPIEMLTFIEIFMSLKADKRGLHMSRIERILYSAQKKQYESLVHYTQEVIYPLIETQNTKKGKIYLKAVYEKETDKNPSGRKGHEILNFYIRTAIKNNQLKTFVGLGVYFMNACPCPQRWAIKEMYYKLKEKGYSEEEIKEIIKIAPLESHTNRGLAKLFIEDPNISFKDLYQILDSSVTIVRELLSGDDEHLFIREAHEKELFCEDVIRNIAYETVKYLDGKVNENTKIFINAEVDESIHFHNLYGEIKTTFGKLRKELKENNENI